MTRPVLYGADYSVYVRIARMALIEKGVDHEQVSVDVFAQDGVPDWYLAKHPFGRIPAFEHDGFALYETAAITRYVDEAFEGPALQPDSARDRATMSQIVAMLDSYAYRPLVWGISVETVDKPREGAATNQSVVDAALPVAAVALAELARLQQADDRLVGGTVSLADLHAAPILAYFLRAPLAARMLAKHPRLEHWWHAISARKSFRATEPSEG